MSIRRVVTLILVAGLVAGFAFAQDQMAEQIYEARAVAMGAGAAGVLQIHVTRWTSEEERQALANVLVQKGQEEFVKQLRAQDETGWVRTQGGRGMRGAPSVRLHYAHDFPQDDGSRLLILVTDRPIGAAEAMSGSRSSEYDVSAVVLQVKAGDDGKETGEGTLYAGVKLGYDADKKKIEVESLGQQPIRLTDVRREK